VLGIARARRALRAIERGEVAKKYARATLDRLGLAHIELDRRVGEVSGGEAVLLGLATQFLVATRCAAAGRATNNFDPHARRRLYHVLAVWPGVMCWSATTAGCWSWSGSHRLGRRLRWHGAPPESAVVGTRMPNRMPQWTPLNGSL